MTIDHRTWTRWYLEQPGGKPKFSHLSVGYDVNATVPTPVTQFQRQSWAHSRWIGKRAVMVKGAIVEREA